MEFDCRGPSPLDDPCCARHRHVSGAFSARRRRIRHAIVRLRTGINLAASAPFMCWPAPAQSGSHLEQLRKKTGIIRRRESDEDVASSKKISATAGPPISRPERFNKRGGMLALIQEGVELERPAGRARRFPVGTEIAACRKCGGTTGNEAATNGVEYEIDSTTWWPIYDDQLI